MSHVAWFIFTIVLICSHSFDPVSNFRKRWLIYCVFDSLTICNNSVFKRTNLNFIGLCTLKNISNNYVFIGSNITLDNLFAKSIVISNSSLPVISIKLQLNALIVLLFRDEKSPTIEPLFARCLNWKCWSWFKYWCIWNYPESLFFCFFLSLWFVSRRFLSFGSHPQSHYW